MDPIVCAYWTAKSGTSADEYEDAFAFSPGSRHFAIADGATESSFADRWAQSLVQKYSREPPSSTGGKVPLPDWVKPLQKEWHEKINWETLPWFAEEKARLGAFATFLGVSFSHPINRRGLTRFLKKTDTDKLIWRACAIGDSCLFQIRDGELLKAFPLTRSDQFNSRPVLLCSNPENNGPVWDAVEVAEGDCTQGDIFFALTDALAKWFLAEIEAGNKPWSLLGEVQSAPTFEEFIGQLRSSKSIRNDDTTMLSFQWIKESRGAKNTVFKTRK